MKCFVCDQPISGTIHSYNDDAWNKSDIFINLNIYHCDHCGLGFTSPDISIENLTRYYSTIYRAKNSPFYFDFSSDLEPVIPKSYPYAEERSFSQILMSRFFCELNKNDIFLDIGPGKGGSFAFAKLMLPEPRLYGIELTDGASEFFKRNFGALTYGSLTDFIATNEKSKILLMSHSLEHYQLSDLDQLFEEIKTAMKDDGVLVIEVPHCDMRIHASVRGNDTPHTLFFSKTSLRALLEKFGFDVLFIDTCSDLWRTKEAYKELQASTGASLKKKFKSFYNTLPTSFQNGLRSCARFYYKIRNSKVLSNGGYYTSLPQHTYGGNRNCLRAVAKKKA